MKRFIISSLVLTAGAAFAVACADDSDNISDLRANAVSTYSLIVEASYADSVSTAQALDATLENLVANPSEQALTDAQQAWLDSREPYLQTEVYRFYNGPIDNDDLDGPEGLINAWPLDEGYIDYIDGDATSGIVNGTDTIDSATLESLNEVGGETNVATGYHAIEFLLWGQDQNENGPGERAYTDYVVSSNGPNGCYSGPPTHACACGGAETECVAAGGPFPMWTDQCNCPTNAERRGQYLTVVGDMLVGHLSQLQNAWAPSATYRVGFESDPVNSFGKILTGMIILSGFETGSERLKAALVSKDQEDEHSCFSDNTHRDMVQDVQGIANVWNGSYTRVDGSVVSGTSVKDVVAAKDADLAARVDAQIKESLALAKDLRIPFDQEISAGNAEGNARVQALITALTAQEAVLFEVFDAFDLTVDIPGDGPTVEIPE